MNRKMRVWAIAKVLALKCQVEKRESLSKEEIFGIIDYEASTPKYQKEYFQNLLELFFIKEDGDGQFTVSQNPIKRTLRTLEKELLTRLEDIKKLETFGKDYGKDA